ncbi:MAG: hypothetical protein ACXVCV_18275, partial [Polyangia bacterium]
MFRLITLVLPLLAGIPGNFKLVGSKHGVDVYRQMSSRVIDLVAEGNIEAPPEVVRDVVLDFANATKVTDNINESRVLLQNDREIIVYQRLRLPVIHDRDFTLRVTWGRKGDVLTTRSAVDNSRGPQPREGIVRMSLLQCGWEFEPI